MPSWFTEGTVNVTNGTVNVIGVGTKFSNCRSGDMFVGPDGAIYQVINAPSDTALSISPTYRGVNANGAVYGIVPVNGYPKALADAVNQMLLQWGEKLAALGTTGNYDTLPISKGGTGAATQAGARTALGLGTAAVATLVGTPSDSAPGRVLTVGYGGIGAKDNAVFEGTFRGPDFYLTGGTVTGQFIILGMGLTGSLTTHAGSDSTVCDQSFMDWANGQSYTRVRSGSVWQPWRKVYNDANTTRAADGTLKAI